MAVSSCSWTRQHVLDLWFKMQAWAAKNAGCLKKEIFLKKFQIFPEYMKKVAWKITNIAKIFQED